MTFCFQSRNKDITFRRTPRRPLSLVISIHFFRALASIHNSTRCSNINKTFDFSVRSKIDGQISAWVSKSLVRPRWPRAMVPAMTEAVNVWAPPIRRLVCLGMTIRACKRSSFPVNWAGTGDHSFVHFCALDRISSARLLPLFHRVTISERQDSVLPGRARSCSKADRNSACDSGR